MLVEVALGASLWVINYSEAGNMVADGIVAEVADVISALAAAVAMYPIDGGLDVRRLLLVLGWFCVSRWRLEVAFPDLLGRCLLSMPEVPVKVLLGLLFDVTGIFLEHCLSQPLGLVPFVHFEQLLGLLALVDEVHLEGEVLQLFFVLFCIRFILIFSIHLAFISAKVSLPHENSLILGASRNQEVIIS